MKRTAFTMRLKPGFRDEYKRRHDEIWPELKSLLKEAGISEYSIFLDETSDTLFAFQKIDEGSTGSQELGRNEIVQQWWAYMADIMETEDDNSPVTRKLPELFYLG
ncbi:MAG: L-rhamnose mutarotase [Sphaerochaetaceae bacterium]|nr:L-rhamnose mutarotase [Sphaerochaetaceae bacterium]